MSYNEQMRQKLKGNIFGVIFFLLISAIFVGFKLSTMFGESPTLLEIQGVLIAKDIIVFGIFGLGLIALGLSIYLYYKFDSFYPQNQVKLFMGIGLFFLPFTIILVVIGIMKYMEKSKFKKSFFVTSIISLLAFGIFASVSVTQLQEIEPIYTSKYTFEAEYILGADDYVNVTVVAIIRGSELQSVTVDAVIQSDLITDPTRVGEYYRMSIGDSASLNAVPSCFNIPNTLVLEEYEYSCEITEFIDSYSAMTASTFINFDEFYFEYGYMDVGGIWTREIAEEMNITKRVVDLNIYDDIE